MLPQDKNDIEKKKTLKLKTGLAGAIYNLQILREVAAALTYRPFSNRMQTWASWDTTKMKVIFMQTSVTNAGYFVFWGFFV